ncbi:MAG: hypothetical protein ACREHD_14600, partial [Pirellulales bacterium]
DNVPPEVWNYEFSGKGVLTQWFSYRKRHRERPIMGDRRPPPSFATSSPTTGSPTTPPSSSTSFIFSAASSSSSPEQAELLDEVCSRTLITATELAESGALALPPNWRKALKAQENLLFCEAEEGDE